MDRLQSMRVFARVVDRGSLAAAARELDLSPAVVTRLLADLEAHLGARLLNRSTRRLALTDVGEAYLERVRQILAEIDEAEALAQAATREPRGPLRLLMPPSFATHQFTRHLPRFCERHPRITVELAVRTGVLIEGADEEADLTVILAGRSRPLKGDFVARLLARSDLVACAAPAYLARHGVPQAPAELLQHQSLIPALPHIPQEWVFQRAGGEGRSAAASVIALQLPAHPALVTAHVDTLLAAAQAGMGIVYLPSFILADALAAGTLQRLLPDWQLGSYRLHAALRSRRHLAARTRAMLDFLVEVFGGEDRDPWLPPR